MQAIETGINELEAIEETWAHSQMRQVGPRCTRVSKLAQDTGRVHSYLLNCFTKKSAMMWLASIASGNLESYQKAWVSASKTTSRASTPALM